MKILEKIKFWFECARYHALGQSLWAALVAISMASVALSFDLKYALVALFGVLFAHLSINMLDDYFDYKSGSVDKRNALEETVRSGKCSYLYEKKATPKELFICAGVFGLIAFSLGLILFVHRGMPVLVLTVLAIILGYFYSAPPLKLSYNGFGELVVGLMFGPMLMNGVYYCATGTISLVLLLISLAVGSLVINILYVHSIMDVEADSAVGKNTLATALRIKIFKLIAVIFFAIYPYWIIVVGVARYHMPKMLLLTLLTLPLSIILVKFMADYLNGDKKSIKRQKWMGPMEKWDKITEIGIDWFMIRWYMARNIMIAFSAIVCAVYVLKALI